MHFTPIRNQADMLVLRLLWKAGRNLNVHHWGAGQVSHSTSMVHPVLLNVHRRMRKEVRNVTSLPSLYSIIWSHPCEKMIYALKKKSVKDRAEFFSGYWWRFEAVVGIFSLLASFWKVWTFTMTMCDFLMFIFNAGDIYSKKMDTKRYTMISLSIPGLSRNILPYQFPM